MMWSPRFRPRTLSTPIDELPLQHPEEAFGRGIVGASASELASTIRVQDDRLVALALPLRHSAPPG
jgi:hypothetical protein